MVLGLPAASNRNRRGRRDARSGSRFSFAATSRAGHRVDGVVAVPTGFRPGNHPQCRLLVLWY